MILRRSSRAILVALAMIVCGAGAALAHALPGSTLLMQRQGDALHLTITFPVEDLVIAAPDLAALEGAPVNDKLPADMAYDLKRYLADHLSLSGEGGTLPQTMRDARLRPAYEDHLGDFSVVITEWEFQAGGAGPDPLTLRYDAIMHEVRNHRAMVQWRGRNGNLRLLSVFGFPAASDGVVFDAHLNQDD
ncbi:hypothetical protein [Jannaschia sp. 2305UL9-9]|uniref:hypothetical protein n=1 Tax=Jannaschia sp. 2305UL9-9 TaxID=3121638 RepID=UPI0035279AAE